jgi:hypothetical protein
MTRDDALLADIDDDLQRSGRHSRVVYLEGRSKEQCRAEWIQEAVRRGGHAEVRSLWARALRPQRS